MVENTTGYKQIVCDDELEPGNPKNYLNISREKGIAICRARSNTMEPKPRKREWEKPYRCKLCLVKDQSSKHYMMDLLIW